VLVSLMFVHTISTNLSFILKSVFFLAIALNKGCKCLHIPSNRIFISCDVVFDKNMFPFSHTSFVPENTPLASSPDQFVDVAHAPSLLPNHGVGIGRGAHLELLEDVAPSADHAASGADHVDHPAMHGLLHGSSLAPVLPASTSLAHPTTGPARPSAADGRASPPSSPPPSTSPSPRVSLESASPSPGSSPESSFLCNIDP
jgi:hypothetical protein